MSASLDPIRDKHEVREYMWALLEREGKVQSPSKAHGKIPNFVGAGLAADRLASLWAWQQSRVLKINPDKAQRPVRENALIEERLVYMPVPRLADALPFYALDPDRLGVSPQQAASKEGAARVGDNVGVDQLEPVDLVVCGTVVVNRDGIRVGKGGGFSDLEVAMLIEAGLVHSNTIFATTVHPLQVVNEPLPETDHDFRVDVIVTAEETTWCGQQERPPGILWDHLEDDKIAAVPFLADLAAKR